MQQRLQGLEILVSVASLPLEAEVGTLFLVLMGRCKDFGLLRKRCHRLLSHCAVMGLGAEKL